MAVKTRTPMDLLEKARALRANPTGAEKTLWHHLRNRQLNGLRFRRQVPVGPYIVDFLCHAENMIIEIDGGPHAGLETDQRRTAYLEAAGYRVQRFWNHDVLTNTNGVLEQIGVQGEDAPHPGPPPRGEGTPVARSVQQSDGPAGLKVSLTYEQRYRRRALLTTDCGTRFLLDLPSATELKEGDVLALDGGGTIEVRAAPEPLARVAGAGLARLAWHIGNRHTPCQVAEDHLLIQRDHVLEDMLRGLGAEVTHVDAPFQPEGGAYGHGRTHGHAHSHSAHDDPNAHIPHRHD